MALCCARIRVTGQLLRRCFVTLSCVQKTNYLRNGDYVGLNVGNLNLDLNKPSKFLTGAIKINTRGYKKTSKSTSSKEPDSDEEDEEEELDQFDKKTMVKYHLQSRRVDLLLKSALGMARNKIEDAFYESRIKLNGKKLLKKSQAVDVGDEVDLIKGDSPVNPNHMIIARIEIVDIVAKEESILISMRRFKNLTVEKEE